MAPSATFPALAVTKWRSPVDATNIVRTRTGDKGGSMRVVLMVSKIPAANETVVLTGVWLAPRHFGGGGSTPIFVVL